MKVFKWDDDLAVVLPQELIDQLGLKEGDDIEVVAADGSTTPAEPKDLSGSRPKSPPR